MKIRIIGSCGSGKSYLSRELSRSYDIPYFELDQMIWDRSADNRKFPLEVRDASLRAAVNSPSWVIEGVQHKWTDISFAEADIIIILKPNVFMNDYRIIRRFIRARTGIEPWNYKQSLRNLIKMMVMWNHRFNFTEIIEATEYYSHKRFYIRKSRDALNLLQIQCEVN